MTLHLGLDLGGTNIKAAVLQRNDEEFEVVAADSTQTEAASGPEIVTRNLIMIARRIAEDIDPVDTVGLGVPGHFDRETGRIIIFPNLPGDWPGYNLRDEIHNALATPEQRVWRGSWESHPEG